MKISYLIGLCVFVTACNSQSDIFQQMENAENMHNKRMSKELVVFMSLETMFPDKNVRALAKAAGKGKLKKIDKLVDAGINVNARGLRNATPLFWAMHNKKGFEHLLKLGADPNVIFDDKGSVMHWAVGHEDIDFLKLALKYGGDPNLVGGINKRTPLFDAVAPDNKEKVSVLLDAGADMNFQSGNGETPMMLAAGLGQFDVVYQLLQLGADYKLKDYYSKGTLMNDIAFSKRTIDPNSDGAYWMQKVIQWLNDRGETIPEWKDPSKK